jgi:ribosomal protein S18 acetylase RimI-like enzyme
VGKIDFSNITELEQQEQEAAAILANAGSGEEHIAVPSVEKTGYIGMLAVMASHRRMGIGTSLVTQVLRRMRNEGCSSVTLETEVSNGAAQRLYQDEFGFIREELLVRYYLNWGDAYRLRLWFAHENEKKETARITQ